IRLLRPRPSGKSLGSCQAAFRGAWPASIAQALAQSRTIGEALWNDLTRSIRTATAGPNHRADRQFDLVVTTNKTIQINWLISAFNPPPFLQHFDDRQ